MTTSVLITGANQGLGFFAAQHMVAKPNIDLFLGSRSLEKGLEAASKLSVHPSSTVQVIELDVTLDASVEAAKTKVSEALGDRPLDVLVNNAGVASALTTEVTRAEYQRIYSTNVFGVAAVTNAFLPLLKKAEKPRLVNVSSGLASISKTAAYVAAGLNVPAYATSKSALNAISVYYASNNPDVTVLNLCPGFNSTNMTSYQGGKPEEGSQIIVDAALGMPDAKSGTFFNKDGPLPW